MKQIRVRPIVAALAAAVTVCTSARAQFTPVPLTASSYQFDIVIESNYTVKASTYYVTATMDNGPTTNTAGMFQGNTWFEIGTDLASNNVGFPHAGTLVTNQVLPNHYYQLAPSWAAPN